MPKRVELLLKLALVGALMVLVGLIFGAQRLREDHVHRPVCAVVCGKRGMRYEGVLQARKNDHAVACHCVSPKHERATIPTRFFSDNWLLDSVAALLTSTLGVLSLPMFLVLGALLVGWVRDRFRRAPPPSSL